MTLHGSTAQRFMQEYLFYGLSSRLDAMAEFVSSKSQIEYCQISYVHYINGVREEIFGSTNTENSLFFHAHLSLEATICEREENYRTRIVYLLDWINFSTARIFRSTPYDL